jgi:Tol biopolymer transport system component/DNA-binding winged helix-turn-helix (wHTH) protein
VKVRLERKPWQLLVALLEKPGEILSREEIEKRLWPEGVFVDFEHGVNVAVKKLRQALLDSAAEPRYVGTIPGEGYSFIAALQEVTSARLAEPPPVSMASATLAEARPRWQVRWRLPGLVFASLFAVGTVWVGTSLRQPGRPRHSMVIARLIADSQARVSAGTSISADGKYAAYELDEAGKRSVWVRQLSTASAIRVAELAVNGPGATTFSHDGSFLYYRDGPRVMMVPTLGGPSREVGRGSLGPVCVSPDGRHLAYTRNLDQQRTALVLADADGAGDRVLAERRRPMSWFLFSCSWSPNGKAIAIGGNAITGDRGFHTLLAVDAQSGVVSQISGQTWDFVGRLNWLSDNSGIVFEASAHNEPAQLYEMPLPHGTATRLTGDMTTEYARWSTVLADDGRTAVAVRRVSESKIWIVPGQDPSASRQLAADDASQGIRGLSSTSDGRVLFSSNVSGSPAIWIAGPNAGTVPRKITSDEVAGGDPEVTSDGRYMVFAGRTAHRFLPFRQALDGGSLKPLGSGSTVTAPKVAPDSQWVFYGRNDALSGGGWALWKSNLDSGEEKLVTTGQIWPLGFTPDGKLMLAWPLKLPAGPFAMLSTETWTVTKPVPLPPRALLAAENFAPPRLTPNGASVSYVDIRDGAENIWAQSLNGGDARQLTHFVDKRIFSFAWTRNGDLIVARGTQTSDAVLIRDLR